jgi:hypothetical protein
MTGAMQSRSWFGHNHIVATQGVVVGSEDCEDQLIVRLVVQYILAAPVVVFVDIVSEDGTGTTTGMMLHINSQRSMYICVHFIDGSTVNMHSHGRDWYNNRHDAVRGVPGL